MSDKGKQDPPQIDDQQELASWLADTKNNNKTVTTRLKTNDRIIARVTDGIYRQPGSALRELISNAWDADANEVTIHTDTPRFSRIIVRDDGRGMSYDTLCHLLHSIGGSAKRTAVGTELGISSEVDPELTPGGRPLIGKIGIGMFSVSQLGRAFRIVTKTKGSDYRLVADVTLNTYSEDIAKEKGNENFISGNVTIRREASSDKEAHGTDIILESIKPLVRDLLRSADRWTAVQEKEDLLAKGEKDSAAAIRIERPAYHSGWISDPSKSKKTPDLLKVAPNYPWGKDADAGSRMQLLMDAVESISSDKLRPDIANVLDTYLEMLWSLGLSSPVDYVDSHPFDLKKVGYARLFWIANDPKGQASEINWKDGEDVRSAITRLAPGNPILEAGKKYAAGSFKVMIDGLELRRPIRFRHFPGGRNSPKGPLMFVGKFSPNLAMVTETARGGALDVEGYLFWNGRIIPKENNGVMIRIRGTSGALFDSTFFKYQVSEQTRLRQITSELFVAKGLDPALNIDRESFNFSHPHVQLLTLWLHRAVRQLTNRSKMISGELRADHRIAEKTKSKSAIAARAEATWTSRKGEELPPEIKIASDATEAKSIRTGGDIAIARASLPSLIFLPAPDDVRDSRVKALLQLLAAYDLLEDLPYVDQEKLVDDIIAIFI